VKPDVASALYTWLSPQRCAAEIGMSEEFVRQEIREGRLPASDFGRGRTPRYRVRPEDWTTFLRERELRRAS